MDVDTLTRQFHAEREQWHLERDKLSIANEAYLKDIRKLNEDIHDMELKVLRAEHQVKGKEDFFNVEKEGLLSEIEDLKNFVQQKQNEVSEVKKDASERITQALKERAEIDVEISLKESQIKDLERVLQLTQDELDLSRKEYDEMRNQIDLALEKVADLEANIQAQATDFDFELRKKDDIIADKQHTIDTLIQRINDCTADAASENALPGGQFHLGNLNLLEENADLRKKLNQLKAENEHYVRQRQELLKEFRQREMRGRSPQSDLENLAQERCKKLEVELNDRALRVDQLSRELEALKRRNKELERANAELISQFTSSILPFDELISDDEYPKKFNHFKEIVEDNLKLRQTVEDMSKQMALEPPLSDLNELQEQFEQAIEELEAYKKQTESVKEELQKSQKLVEYYKTRADTGAEFRGETKGVSYSKADAELQIHKLNCELDSVKDRLKEVIEEKQRNEENQNNIISQKNELIAQLYSTKDSLELKVQSHEEATEKMQSQLQELDKTNRKIKDDHTKLKGTTEGLKNQINLLNSQLQEVKVENDRLRAEKKSLELELSQIQRDSADLRARCNSLSDNQTVTNVVLNALTEFRSAYSQINAEQLHLTQAELDNCRKERDTLNQLVSSLQNHQMSGVDALKTALRDAKLSSERFRARCTQAEQDLEILKNVHSELEYKYNQLNKQLTDIDSTDADPDSCRKENQHLRNKIIYYEKQTIEKNAIIDELKAQVKVADERYENVKNAAEIFEKSLKEKELKLQEEKVQRDDIEKNFHTMVQNIESQNAQLIEEKQQKEEQLIQEQQRTQQLVSEYQQKLAQLEEQKSSLETQLNTASDTLQDLTTRFVETSDVMGIKDTEIATLKLSLDSASQQLQNVQTELDAVNKENLELKQAIEEQKQASAESSKEQEAVIASLKQDLAEAERLRNESQSLDQSFYDQATKNLDQMYEKLNSSEDESFSRRRSRLSIGGTAEKTISLQKHAEITNKLNLKLENQEKELAERLAKIVQLERLKDVEQQYQLLKNEFSALEQRLAGAQEDASRIQAQLVQVKQEHLQCAKKQQDAQATVSRMNGQINDLRVEIQEYQNKLNNKAEELAATQQDMQKLQEDIKTLKANNSSFKALALRYRQWYGEAEKVLGEVAPEKAQALSQKNQQSVPKPKKAAEQPAQSFEAPPADRPLKRKAPETVEDPTASASTSESEPQQKQAKED
ncbi:unnamed protein product [Bursaphelenchus xylophilus]|uniref:(pine wood nematode) hypothetical protein n=1 Tax=Bursaphelenchus xylophilus TaxID=6326 RepID=A0A1I7SRU1_BURXY|nr:unnamed protein product [Bursaphelenchus xylophilus]CAG9101853.1 unnamed protein product [Bursaphelenchus xylophilus]